MEPTLRIKRPPTASPFRQQVPAKSVTNLTGDATAPAMTFAPAVAALSPALAPSHSGSPSRLAGEYRVTKSTSRAMLLAQKSSLDRFIKFTLGQPSSTLAKPGYSFIAYMVYEKKTGQVIAYALGTRSNYEIGIRPDKKTDEVLKARIINKLPLEA